MQNKVKELYNVITQNPPDMKKLQLVLQGSVSVQACVSLLSGGGKGLLFGSVGEKHVIFMKFVCHEIVKFCSFTYTNLRVYCGVTKDIKSSIY